MFNENVITKVLYASPKDDAIKTNSCFGLCPIIEYRVTKGEALILQTENDYIVLDYEGVRNCASLPYPESEFDVVSPNEEEDLEEDEDPYIAPESLLFAGEHLLDVTKESDHYVLYFDDFSMNLYVYSYEDFEHFNDASYFPITGFERHIKRKCQCGGTPHLMLDFVSDFFIECDKCHATTSATFDMQYVIDWWNEGDVFHSGIGRAEELFKSNLKFEVNRIALPEMLGRNNNPNLIHGDEIIVEIKDKKYIIGSQRIAENRFGFTFHICGGYNEKSWPHSTESEVSKKLILAEYDEDSVNQRIIFNWGERNITFEATKEGIIVEGI